jgi:hypothetical protein
MKADSRHDPAVSALLEDCRAVLNTVRQRLPDVAGAGVIEEVDLAALGPMPLSTTALYATATRLCDEGAFRDALLPALVLCTWHPTHPHALFLAGTCLQRTGQPAAALLMFSQCGQAGDASLLAASALRCGECLASIGHKDHAARAFRSAVEACRPHAELSELQTIAQAKADALAA